MYLKDIFHIPLVVPGVVELESEWLQYFCWHCLLLQDLTLTKFQVSADKKFVLLAYNVRPVSFILRTDTLHLQNAPAAINLPRLLSALTKLLHASDRPLVAVKQKRHAIFISETAERGAAAERSMFVCKLCSCWSTSLTYEELNI